MFHKQRLKTQRNAKLQSHLPNIKKMTLSSSTQHLRKVWYTLVPLLE